MTGQAPAAAAAPAGAPAALPLRVEHLSVAVRARRGGDARILCDVSLTARPGEIVAVVGESGCG
ncbi:MAG TPA: hypothetical protein VKV35_14025, partial [Streptosporangiaceae bacterium]|nr:hypothetical protein [Streptosporangiaceae bacterium]